jgi:hypothetical protein
MQMKLTEARILTLRTEKPQEDRHLEQGQPAAPAGDNNRADVDTSASPTSAARAAELIHKRAVRVSGATACRSEGLAGESQQSRVAQVQVAFKQSVPWQSTPPVASEVAPATSSILESFK